MLCSHFSIYTDIKIWSLSQNLDCWYLPEVKLKWSILNEYLYTSVTWGQILKWQLILKVGIVHHVTGCAFVWKCCLEPSQQKQKNLFTIFVHRNMEPDPKNMSMVRWILRSQLLISYGNGKGEESRDGKPQIWQPHFYCHSFQPPFIRAVTKEQKNMEAWPGSSVDWSVVPMHQWEWQATC